MTMAKKLPLLAPSIHTFEVNGTYTDCEAKRSVLYLWQFKKWYPLENTIGFCIMAPRKKATLIKEKMAV